jgi:tRNA threonylcarbamoyladenosine biosynthesis protein TsaE
VEFRIKAEVDLKQVAKYIVKQHRNDSIFIFKGAMGAGKTTLIKQICKSLGVISETSSPTFSLINEYETNRGEVVYHFDFYRLESEDEAYDYGYEEYFYSGNKCFIEWPEKTPGLIPDKFITIEIDVDGFERVIRVG